MPKFKIANKVYDISDDQVNKFKALARTKGYKIEEVLDEQPINIGGTEGKPQAVAKTGAPATAPKTAPVMDSRLDVGSLDLLPEEISFKEEEVKSLKERLYIDSDKPDSQQVLYKTYGEYYDSGLASPKEQRDLEKLISIYGRDYKNPVYRTVKAYEKFIPAAKKRNPDASESEIVLAAKNLYIEDGISRERDKRVSKFLSDKGGVFSNWDEKDTETQRLQKISEQTKYSLAEKEKNLSIIDSSLKTLQKQAVAIKNKKYTTQAEVDLANKKIAELQGTFDDLLKKNAELVDGYFLDAEKFSDSQELLDVFKRSYTTSAVSGYGLLGSVSSIAGGIYKIPEWLVATTADAIGGAEAVKKVRSAFSKYVPTSMAGDYLMNIAEEAAGLVEKPQSIGEISSIGDAADWAVNMISSQVPVIATLVVAPEIGLEMIAASSAGQKYEEMGQEIDLGKEYSFGQMLFAPIINASAEYLTEKITAKQIRGLKNVFSSGEKNEILNAASKYIDEQLVKGTFLKDSGKEAFGEGVSQLSSNISDHYLLDKNNSLWEGVPDALAGGAFMSMAMKSPVIALKLARPFADNKDMSSRILQNTKLLNDIQIELNKETLDPQVKKDLENKKKELLKSNSDILSKHYESISDLNADEVQKLIDIDVKMAKVANSISAINNDQSLSEDTKENLIKDFKKEANSLSKDKFNSIREAKKRNSKYSDLSDEDFEIQFNNDVDQARTFTALINPNDKVEVFKNKAEQDKWLKANTGLSGKDISGLNGNGSFVTDNDGNNVLILNKDNAKKSGYVTTGMHESFHLTLKNWANASDAQLKKLKLPSLSNASAKLARYINNNMSDIDLATSDFGIRFSQYADKLEKGEIETQDFWEEAFPLLSEAIERGEIKFKENIFTKIGDIISKAMQTVGLRSQFASGRDVYNFVKDYNKSFKAGELSRGLKKIQDIQLEGEIEQDIKESISPEDNADLALKFKTNKESILRDKRANTLISKIAKRITQKFYDPIAPDAKRGVARDEYEITAQTELSLIALEWNPDKQDFGKFLANRGFLRLSDLAKRLGIESTVEYGGVGIMDDVETSKEAQGEIEEEFKTYLKEAEVLPEKDTLLGSLDVNQEIEGKPVTEHFNKSLEIAVKKSIKEYSEDLSPNRTIAPFIASIKQVVSVDLRKMVKAWINSKGYAEFLTENKGLLLDNYTTTYLSKHPLFKKGVQKSVGGKTETDNQGNQIFIPNWVDATFVNGKWTWLDANGNETEGDRDSAGFTGKTSGPIIMRRHPKIKSIITTAEFVDYHYQDGPQRKKKKQNPEDALAMQIAAELGFEVLKNDLLNAGPISAAFVDVAELKGKIITQAELDNVVKLADRGGLVKQSLYPAEADFLRSGDVLGQLLDAYEGNTIDNSSVKDTLIKLLKLNKGEAGNISKRRVDYVSDLLFETFNNLAESIKITKTNVKAILFNPTNNEENIYLLAGLPYVKLSFATKDTNGNEIIQLTKEGKEYIDDLKQKLIGSLNSITNVNSRAKALNKYLKYELPTLTAFRSGKSGRPSTYGFLKTQAQVYDVLIKEVVDETGLSNFYKVATDLGPRKSGSQIQYKYTYTNNAGEQVSSWAGVFATENTYNIKSKQLGALNSMVNNAPVDNVTPPSFNSEAATQAKGWVMARFETLKRSKDPDRLKKLASWLKLQTIALDSPLRTMAWVKYADPNWETLIRTKGASEWEHMIPASIIARAMMANAISEKLISNEELSLLIDNYYVALISQEDNLKLKTSNLNHKLGELYKKLGLLPENTRYKKAGIDTKKFVEFNKAGAVVRTPKGTKAKQSVSVDDVAAFDRMISEKAKLPLSEIGEVTASRLGKNKGKFKFFIPPSADDFMGLMYHFVRSGEQGNKDLLFIKDKLVDPFAKGMAAYESYKQNSLNQFRAFKREVKKTPADLSKKNEYGFTNEQAARVYLWYKKQLSEGKSPSIPGLTNSEMINLVKLVERSPQLLNFANNVSNLMGLANGYPDVKENWWGTSMTIDILDTLNDKARKEFLASFIENVEAIFGKLNNKGEITGPIANKLRAAYGDNYIEALSDVLYRMKNGRGREFGKNRLANKFNNWISNAVGSIMFLNTRSALLQQVSLVNFINLSDNNPIAFAQAIANTEQYAADYIKLLNSDFLKQRRGGLAIDVNEDEIAKAVESGGNSLSNIISVILKKGFVLTTWADSHAIASGGATFYRNRVNTYVKQGMTVEDAEAKAFFEFKELAEESQQSSRPDKISQQQASSLGRIILAFANTPMQYARITKKAALDLINRRGDWKTNTSKLLYYGALQNIMFTYMQQALFALAFGDDEEEDTQKDEDRYIFAANGMADGFLRGLGFGGAVAATAKNMVLEAIEQEQGRKDYDEVVWKALTLSPPLSSKIDKARSVARTFTWKQQREKIFTEGVSLDNPAFEAVGKTTSVLTNIPLDRVIRKADNITTPIRQDVEFWQAFALYMGYGKYELDLYEKSEKKQPKRQGTKSGKKSGKREVKR